MRLAIIIGHSRDKKGAAGVYPIAEYEYDFNYKLAMDFFRQARNIGLECQLFDKTNSLHFYKSVNEYLKDGGCSIELHFNAVNGQVQGSETLYVLDSSKDFASLIHETICLELKRKGKANRGIKLLNPEDRGYKNLALLVQPACLIEPAFVDNKIDARIYYDNKDKMVESIVLCVEKYFLSQVE